MKLGDKLIGDIVNATQIPSPRKRHAMARELQSHLEDSVDAACAAGRSDARRVAHFRLLEPAPWIQEDAIGDPQWRGCL